MKKLKDIKEQIVNTVGSGQVAGLEPDIPPVPKGVTTKGSMLRRKKFANTTVFVVPSDSFHKARLGKAYRKHYKSYVGGELGEEIRQYANENPNDPIIVEDEITGAMVYLKYGKR
jgi:hypothetical protein